MSVSLSKTPLWQQHRRLNEWARHAQAMLALAPYVPLELRSAHATAIAAAGPAPEATTAAIPPPQIPPPAAPPEPAPDDEPPTPPPPPPAKPPAPKKR